MDDHSLVFDEDACNSARFTSEITSLTYSPSTNCLVALVKEHIQVNLLTIRVSVGDNYD